MSPDHRTPTTETAAPRRWLPLGLTLLVGLALVAGWWLSRNSPSTAPGSATSPAASASVAAAATVPLTPTGRLDAEVGAQPMSVQVLATFPHDANAFTQGLVWDAGRLFESTGLEGRSSLREVDPATGQVLRKVDLAPDIFGEGLAMVDDRLVQITWKNAVAFDWKKDSFDKLGEFQYTGEGWGLCRDGDRLIMSDGSDQLSFRDPVTFALTGKMAVTLDGSPVHNLNELECVGDDVYANIWLTDWIYRIDKTTGQVNAVIDAAGLLTPAEQGPADVLNGIAFKPETGTFLITGKLWPKLFEVRFVQSEALLPIAVTPMRRP